MFLTLLIFILSLVLKNIISRKQEIKLWEYTYEEPQIIADEGEEILSYSWNEEKGAELFFIKNEEKYYFYLKDDSRNQKIPYNNLIEIKSPLFLYNSSYFFCASPPALMYINENSIGKIDNPEEVKDEDAILKCLKGPYENSIAVAFLKTEYLFLYEPLNNKYILAYRIENLNFIAINYFHDSQNLYEITAIAKNKYNSKYSFFNLKYDNQFTSYDHDKNDLELKIYSEVEISTKYYFDNNNVVISYIFSYEKNTENFTIYRIDLHGKFYEFKFFHSFKNFYINFAKYFSENTLLYYIITSSVPDKNQEYKSYIGVIDIEYNFGLFNIESSNKGKIYFNNDTYNQEYKLIFIMNYTKSYFCPFVNQNGKCTFDIKNNKISMSKKNDDRYYNYYLKDCQNYKELGNYCSENCTDGFYIKDNSDNKCEFCPVDGVNHIFYYITGECKHSQYCDEEEKKESGMITTCYDCEKGNKLYYDFDCIDNCAEIFGEKNESNPKQCIKCEDKKSDNINERYFFSLNEEKCTLCENGVKDYNKSLCSECIYNENGNKSYFGFLNKCVKDCKEYNSININNACIFCENNEFYEEGYENCSNDYCRSYGYGIISKNFSFEGQKKTLNLCVSCIKYNESGKIYLQDKYCTNNCEGEYKKIGKDYICAKCNGSYPYFFEDTQNCTEKCPSKTKVDNNAMTCHFCPKDQFYSESDLDGVQCLQKCKENQEARSETYKNIINYNYCFDLKCPKNKIFINGSCQNCTGQFYSPSNNSCYKCFCWSENNEIEYHCNQTNGQCFCPDKYYGYSCEFYFEEGNEEMKIITLNNRLIKSSKNYFTYILSDHNTLQDKFNFIWKVYFNDIEISSNESFTKYFTTALNEKIFGINKEIFDERGNNSIHISLNITQNNESIYYSKIRLNIIELIEEISNFEPKYDNIIFNEMETHLNIKLINGKEKYQGRYEFQYGLVDENNERLPLTDYIESDQVDLNLICPVNFDINIRNDREEEKNFRLQRVVSCNPSDFPIDDILNKSYYISEQIFLLKSYLKSKKNKGTNELDNIINFVDDTINKVINDEGSYTEIYTRKLLESDLNNTSMNIIYSEPKNIFSLINSLLAYRKKQLNKEYVLKIFNSFSLVFENIFKNHKISKKALSDNDVKSLFRAIDNLYDIIIEKNITKENLFYDNFIEVLENISRYLSYKTYPSETIRLIGKRISLLTYNLGKHQEDISFPYIKKLDNINYNNFYINNFSNYSFDNYNMDQKICLQNTTTFLCLTKDNYSDLIEKLNKSYDLNNLTLNIFLLEEMHKNTIDKQLTYDGPDGEQEFQRIILKNNHTAILKLINRDENFTNILNDDNISLEFDLEFPFLINNPEDKKVDEENDNDLIIASFKNIYILIENNVGLLYFIKCIRI